MPDDKPRSRSGLTSKLIRALSLLNLRLIRGSTYAELHRERQLEKRVMAVEDHILDLLQISLNGFNPENLVRLKIITDHPLAFESADHKFPRGTKEDNTRHPRFVARCEGFFGGKIFHLDLGCAGGGLIWDFILNGHQSYGVEGSDFSRINRRAMWRVIERNLFTADITKPFHFEDEAGNRRRFDLITAWEVLEHVPRASLSGFFMNLQNNLAENGMFAASIATFPDQDPGTGVMWHVTTESRSWWLEQFDAAGFRLEEGVFEPPDYPRGSGNPRTDFDWDAMSRPDLGFHVTLRRK